MSLIQNIGSRLLRRRAADRSAGGPDVTAELRRISDRLENLEHHLGAMRDVQRLVPAIARRLFLHDVDLPPPFNLAAQRFGFSSQNEEDGLILALFKRIGMTDRRFVEIGCGVNGGNSGFLAHECGWSGLMVDARSAAIEKIQIRFAGFPVQAIRRKVSGEAVNGMLEKFGFAGELDLLSIDIDGVDYWVWQAVQVARPRLVVIEYNYLFGPEASVTVPYDPEFDLSTKPTRAYRGASLAALVHLGRRKGYRLVATERVNAFFLRNDVAPDIPSFEAAHIYRAPANPREHVFEKVRNHQLPLVVVDAQGEHAPRVLPAETS